MTPQVISRFSRFASLRWRLSLGISGLVLLCTALCIIGAFVFLRQTLTDRAKSELNRTLSGTSGYVENQGSDLRGVAKLVSDAPGVAAAMQRRDRQSLVVSLTPYYADLNADVMDVIDEHGRVVVRMENTLSNGDNALGLAGVGAALAGYDTIAPESDVAGAGQSGGYALRATVPIRSRERVVGAVAVGRQLDSTFASRIGHSANADVNLIAGNQRTGTTLTDNHGLPATGLPEPHGVLDRLATGRVSIAQVHEDGQDVLSGLLPLRGADGQPVGAVEVVRPLGPVYDVTRLLSLLLLVLGAMVVGIGTFLGLSMSRRLTSRLLALESSASEVAVMAHTDAPLGELHVTPVVNGNDEVASLGRSFAAMMTALDERMAVNAELYGAAQARVRELTGLAEIARLLTSVSSLRETMDMLSQRVCRLVGSSAVAIWLPGEGAVPSLHGGHGLPAEYERLSDVTVTQGSIDDETSAKRALRTGEIVHRSLEQPLREGASEHHWTLRNLLRSLGWRSSTAVPLRVQGRVVGALTCYSQSAESLRDSELSLLATIADHVAVVVENARLAAEALRERDEQYLSVFEATSDGLVIGSPEGAFVEVNPAMCSMHRYDREEMLSIDPEVILHPAYRHVYRDNLDTIRRGGTFQTQALDLRKDGTAFPVEIHSSVMLYNGSPHSLSVVRDITERVKAEEQLREKEEQYRSIFEATTDGLLIASLDGVVVEANSAACEMHGYTYADFVGRSPESFVHADNLSLFADCIAAVRAGHVFEGEAKAVRRNGSVFYVGVHASGFTYRGKPHLLAVVRDITERVQAYELLEQRVTERTRELATLLDVSHNVASTLELQPLLDLVLDQLKLVAEYDGAALLRLESDSLVVLARRAPGPDPAVGPERYGGEAARQMIDYIRGGRPLVIDDVRADEPVAQSYRESVGEHINAAFAYERSLLALPMMLKDRIVGVLVLTSSRPNFFSSRHEVLCLAIASQAAVAIENARLYEQAQEVAALEERQRLARELHDSVSQALYGIALGARTAHTLLDRSPERAAEPLEYVLMQAAAGLAEMRALIFELRPEALETEGLVAALEKQVEFTRARHGLEVEASLMSEPEISFQTKEAVYRIAQEAIHNTVKHARANRVRIHLCCEDGGIALEIGDDGRGFDTGSDFPGHLGMKTMRERATQLHGTLHVRSAPEEGTRVRAWVPVETAVVRAG